MVISFQEVTNSAGISLVRQSWGVAWGDFNGDGLPDIWVHNHQQKPVTLYLNQGNGTFQDVTDSVFVAEETIGDFHGSAWWDFDNDGDQDLLQLSGGDQGASDDDPNKRNKLYVNNDGQLQDRAIPLGVDYPLGRARTPVPVDINNDGLLDFVYTGPIRGDGSGAATVFRQTGDGSFENIGNATGLNTNVPNNTFGLIADLAGDDKPELIYLDNSNPLTVYDISTLPFTNITSSVIPNFPNGLNKVKDIVAADFNNDLEVDLYITQQGSPQTGFRRDSNSQIRASLRPSPRKERGIEFDTNNSNVRFDFNGDVSDLSKFFQSTNVSTEDIFIGSSGFNPKSLEFTLNPGSSRVQGIAPFTPTVDRGVYIGYDTNRQTWQLFWSSSRFSDELNVIIKSSTQLSEVTPINFSESFTPSPNFLLLNSSNGLVNRTEESGLDQVKIAGNNAVAGDFDNDMDQDIYVLATGNVKNLPNVLYENQGDGTFVPVANAGGAQGTDLGIGDAVATADYDLDGFLDLYLTNGDVFGFKRPFLLDGPNQLFRNQGNSNNWLQIDLEGTESNRDGIGAQVFATAGGKTQLREQNGGIHKHGQNFQRIHFGLAENTQVDLLEIRWPSGTVQTLENVAANQLLTVVEEGSGTSPTPPPPPPETGEDILYRVNAGGPQIAAIDGDIAWSADTRQNNSPFLSNAGSNNTSSFTGVEAGSALPSSTPDAIFNTERWEQLGGSEMQWAFDVPEAGVYEVRLYMGNGFSGTSNPGQRVFDVALEGNVPSNLDNVDLVDRFGHRVGGVVSNDVTVNDGTLNIEFLHGVENPLINAIEIVDV